MQNSTCSSGRLATVITRNWDTFTGSVRIEGGWLHFAGRRRVGDEYLTDEVERTWPSREVRVIRWEKV